MTDTSRKSALTIVGATGLKQYGGYIREEFLPELTGPRWYRVVLEMSTQDATVAGILFAIQMMMRQVPFPVKPFSEDEADQEVAAYVEECLHDMRESWPITLSEILSFLPWGWAAMEKVYKIRGGEVRRKDGSPDRLRSSKYDDGRIGWGSWSIRGQDSLLHWIFDDETSDAISFVQLPAPDYRPRTVPLSKCMLFRASARKGNPEGVSVLRGAYRAWYFKKRMENLEGIGVELDLTGLKVGRVPAEVLAAQTDEMRATRTTWEQLVVRVHRDEQEGLLLPSDRDEHGNYLYDFQLLTTGGTRQIDTNKIIERYDTRIAASVLADFILIGHQQVGSYSLASSKTTLFATALGAWLDAICTEINAHIPELLRLNGMDPARAPHLTHGDVERVDLEALGPYLKNLQDAWVGGMFDAPGGDRLWRHLLDQAGLPTPTEQEAQAAIEQEQARKEEEERKRQEEAKQRMEQLQQQPPPQPPEAEDEPAPPPARAAERTLSDVDIDAIIAAVWDDARGDAMREAA
jgi:DNA-binding transcriptional MerR regulator